MPLILKIIYCFGHYLHRWLEIKLFSPHSCIGLYCSYGHSKEKLTLIMLWDSPTANFWAFPVLAVAPQALSCAPTALLDLNLWLFENGRARELCSWNLIPLNGLSKVSTVFIEKVYILLPVSSNQKIMKCLNNYWSVPHHLKETRSAHSVLNTSGWKIYNEIVLCLSVWVSQRQPG